jgi:hypothetical protein
MQSVFFHMNINSFKKEKTKRLAFIKTETTTSTFFQEFLHYSLVMIHQNLSCLQLTTDEIVCSISIKELIMFKCICFLFIVIDPQFLLEFTDLSCSLRITATTYLIII